jgi:DHA2 family multidrug resistance protein
MTDAPAPAAPLYRWTVLGIIMLGTFMAILDSSIVNVALPHMMSAFGVNRDRIEWITTGFLLTSAATMPLVGWLTMRFGYKKLYLSSLFLFTIASGLCALAWSFESLVFARIIQAIGTGAIQPVGMAIVAELFRPEERGKALGIWGTGIMVAPALGPTLGGYLTDHFAWRSIFSVNLPVGAATLVGGMLIMREIHPGGKKNNLDIWGYVFLVMALIGGLTALSDGQEKGWNSTYIHTCLAFTVIGLVMFIGVESSVQHPLLDLRLFLIRNYSLSIILGIFRAIGLFGSIFLFPIFLQTQMGYTTIQAGVRMIPGALAVGITMPIAGRLADRYSPAVLSFCGILITGFSLIQFGRLDPLSGLTMIILPQVIRGVGLALLMAPLMTAAINSVPKKEIPTASSFLNISQNVGGAMGIALLNSFVTNAIHRHAVRLAEGLPMQSETFYRFSGKMSQIVLHHTPGLSLSSQALANFGAVQNIFRKTQVLGFENGFVFGGIIVLCAAPICLFLKRAPHQDSKCFFDPEKRRIKKT